MSDNTNNLISSLSAAISKTMENMTFEEVEIVEEPTISDFAMKNKMWAVLPFVSPHAGKLVVEVSQDYCKTLAEEVSGTMDGEVTDETVEDVLAEIANTIAGRFADELLPPDEEFVLGLPVTGRGEAPEDSKKVTTILLNVGGYSLLTSIIGEAFEEFTAN